MLIGFNIVLNDGVIQKKLAIETDENGYRAFSWWNEGLSIAIVSSLHVIPGSYLNSGNPTKKARVMVNFHVGFAKSQAIRTSSDHAMVVDLALWKIWANWDHDIPKIWQKIKNSHVPKHQPVQPVYVFPPKS